MTSDFFEASRACCSRGVSIGLTQSPGVASPGIVVETGPKRAQLGAERAFAVAGCSRSAAALPTTATIVGINRFAAVGAKAPAIVVASAAFNARACRFRVHSVSSMSMSLTRLLFWLVARFDGAGASTYPRRLRTRGRAGCARRRALPAGFGDWRFELVPFASPTRGGVSRKGVAPSPRGFGEGFPNRDEVSATRASVRGVHSLGCSAPRRGRASTSASPIHRSPYPRSAVFKSLASLRSAGHSPRAGSASKRTMKTRALRSLGGSSRGRVNP